MTTVDDVEIINFKCFSESDGSLVPLEFNKEIPFDVKRVFYGYGVGDKNKRGEHAHYTTKQILVCLSGACEVICKDGESERRIVLNSPSQAVLIPEMIWDEQIYASPETILLVFSSTKYNRNDYIEDWQQYKRLRIKSENNKNR